jgi:hypothetical protein
MLIDAGADVNAKGKEPGLPSFNVTLFDQEEWHPLEAAAGRLASPELVRVLLDAGADLTQAPIVLSQAVRGGSLEVLQCLLRAAPRHWWAVRWALKACVVLDRLDMARTIVAATAEDDPTQASPDQALLEAIHLGRGPDWIEALLGSDRHPEAALAIRREAYRVAVRYGHRQAVEILLQHGVDPAAATPVDRMIGACASVDSAALDALLAATTTTACCRGPSAAIVTAQSRSCSEQGWIPMFLTRMETRRCTSRFALAPPPSSTCCLAPARTSWRSRIPATTCARG